MDGGARDPSFILFMSVVAVVAVAIVAPRKFSSWRSLWGDPSDERGYWSGAEPDPERSPDEKSPAKKEDNAA